MSKYTEIKKSIMEEFGKNGLWLNLEYKDRFEDYLSRALDQVREETIEEVEYVIRNDIGYSLRNKPMPEVDDILDILDSLKDKDE